MKKVCFAFIVVLVLTVSISFASMFTDLSDDYWAIPAINKMIELKVLDGYPDKTFKPSNSITRAEFAKILVLALKLNNHATIEFGDVPSTHWAYDYIKNASNCLTGYSRGTSLYYLPDEYALREDMTVAMVYAAGLQNEDYDLSVLDRFSDEDLISEAIKPYIAIAVDNNLVRGNSDGTFNPKGFLTRAEVCQLMYNALTELDIHSNYFEITETVDGLGIGLLNGYYSNVYSMDKVNDAYPSHKFRIFEYTYNGRFLSSQDIDEVWYWFDENDPIKIKPYDDMDAVYSSDTYQTINIKVVYKGKDYIFSYKFEQVLDVIGVVQSIIKKEDGRTFFVIDGKEYEIAINVIPPEVGDVAFLTDYNSPDSYVSHMVISKNDFTSQRTVAEVIDNSTIRLTDNYTITYNYIYDTFPRLVYIEYNDNNEVVKIEKSLSKYHNSFTVKPGDRIRWEKVAVGSFIVMRKQTSTTSNESFFTENINDINFSTYIEKQFKTSNSLRIKLDRYLNKDEKFVLELKYDKDTVEVVNEYFKEKTIEITGEKMLQKLKKANKDFDGKNVTIRMFVEKQPGKEIGLRENNVLFVYDDEIIIDSNTSNSKMINEDVVLTLSRPMKSYESFNVGYMVRTSDSTGRGMSKGNKFEIIDDTHIKISLSNVKNDIFKIINDKQLFTIKEQDGKLFAINIFDKNEDLYDIDLSNIAIEIQPEIVFENGYSYSKRFFKANISIEDLAREQLGL